MITYKFTVWVSFIDKNDKRSFINELYHFNTMEDCRDLWNTVKGQCHINNNKFFASDRRIWTN